MTRPTLAELERDCQKPDYRRLGNWMARRVTRPAALRVTWVVAPWGLSANGATLLAWSCGVGAALALARGTPGSWLAAAALLQLWYLLDHVDGQLARLRGTSSLDGVQLDFLMHHTMNLIVPLGAGHGAFVASGEPVWLWVGATWGIASLLITLHHDARYKTFITRLKRFRGLLEVHGGAGDRPVPPPRVPRHAARLAAWAARKMCETHVVMNVLSILAVTAWLAGDSRLWLGRGYLTLVAVLSVGVAAVTLVRSQHAQAAEREFAAWFRPRPGERLAYREGWWTVEAEDENGRT
ncbi:MAG TPA: CDP-alcohol phosphatidyltransferase family protein [Thermoguttaceae bacterium]|nr:CDP-alcohol phosphatidyltransferase family protein [Thermoguttaceae bacterium]